MAFPLFLTITLLFISVQSPAVAEALDIIPDPVFTDISLKKYNLTRKLGHGVFGDTWIATKNTSEDQFVVKRIRHRVRGRTNFYQSGIREAYFGKKFATNNYTMRFVELFKVNESLFLVSHFEGWNLRSLMYEDVRVDASRRPTKWWHWLKTTSDGKKCLKELIYQLLEAVAFIHEKNVTHRDIKPENIVLCPSNSTHGSCLLDARRFMFQELHLRLIDFGSAIDDFSRQSLYGADGHSSLELDGDYMSPEARFNISWLNGPTQEYDVWAVGQIIMELVIGDPNVFKLTLKETKDIFQATLDYDPMFNTFWRLAWAEYCIIPEGYTTILDLNCRDADFAEHVKKRDRLHLGFQDQYLMNLVRTLLEGDPNKRVSAYAALRDPYFDSQSQEDEVDYSYSFDEL